MNFRDSRDENLPWHFVTWSSSLKVSYKAIAKSLKSYYDLFSNYLAYSSGVVFTCTFEHFFFTPIFSKNEARLTWRDSRDIRGRFKLSWKDKSRTCIFKILLIICKLMDICEVIKQVLSCVKHILFFYRSGKLGIFYILVNWGCYHKKVTYQCFFFA